MESTRGTVAELVMQGWNDHRTGLWFEGRSLTRHEVAAGAAARAALFADLLEPGDRPHLGVLLHNTPEYPLWLSAAALAGAAVAGINPTRGGAESARDLLHTECRVLVTEQAFRPLLDGLDLPGVRVLVTDTDDCADLLAGYEGAEPDDSRATPADRFLLYFTSGSTGAPKAAICTQGRLVAVRPLPGPSLRARRRRRPLHLYADVPRQRGDRRLGTRARLGGRDRAQAALLGLGVP